MSPIMKPVTALLAACLFAVIAMAQGGNNADQLVKEALERRNGGDAAAAVSLLKEAISLRRQARDVRGEAVALKELGNTYQLLGEHRRAIELQRQCLELAETLKDSDLQARALVNLGISLHALGLDDQALDHDRRSLEIALKEDNPAVAAIAQWAIGSLFLDQGKNAEAVEPFKASVDAARRAGNQSQESSGLVYLGLAYSNQGKRAEAIASYRAALELARKLKNRSGEAVILNSLAYELQQSGDWQETAGLFQQALSIGREIESRDIQIGALRGLSLLYLTRSDFPQLVHVSQQLRSLAQSGADPALEEAAAANLARAYTGLDQNEKAAEAYRDLLALAKKNRNLKDVEEALQALGDAASLRGEHEEAVKIYTELLATARELPDPEKEGTTLTSLGAEYDALGRGEEAMKAFEQSLAIAVRHDDKFGQAKVLRKLGIAKLSRGDVAGGIDDLDQGLALTEAVLTEWETSGPLDKKIYTVLREGLSTLVVKLEDLAGFVYGKGPELDETQRQKARVGMTRILARALAQAQRLGDRALEAAILALQSELSVRAGDSASAFDTASRALAVARQAGAEDVESQVLILLAQVSTQRKDFHSSILYEQELLSLARKRTSRPMEALALAMLATDHLQEGDFAKALETAGQAREIALEIKADEVAAHALSILGTASAALMDDDAAIRWSEEAVSLARRMNDFKAESQALQLLGSAYASRGDHVRAISHCRRGLDRADGALAAMLLRCLGVSYGALQDPEQAGEYLQRALDAARKLNDPGLESSLLDLWGYHYSLLDQGEKAASYFQQSAGIRSKMGDPFSAAAAELSLASAQISRRNPRAAVPHFERALHLLDTFKKPALEGLLSALRSASMGTLSSCYAAIGESAKGLSYAEQAWEVQKSSANPTVLAAGLHNLGYAQFLAGKRQAAEETLHKAVMEWERARKGMGEGHSLEKASILDHQMATYERLQQVLIAAGKPEQALEIAERGRARAFVEAITARTGGAPAEPSISTFQRLAREKNLTLVEYSVLYDPNGIVLPSRFNDRQSSSENDLFIWVLKPTGEIVFQKVDLKSFRKRTGGSLASTVRSLRGSVGGRGRTRGVARAGTDEFRQLYDLLIAPIAGHLPANPEDRVVFVPQGPLFLVPFAALRDPSGRYLVEKHTILWAPSIDALVSAPRRAIRADWKSNEILAVGNPVIAAELKLEPYNLADLPSAGEEAVSISRSLGAQALTRDQAGKQEILRLLPQRRLLHFATHGLLEGFGDPLIPGALLLAPSKDDNGLLTAREILDLNLQADLAVLSACDTARGRITSDGVIGLSRALMSAGTPNVVVSLWSVPDAPTSFLMQRFYAELKSKPDPGRALRQAMLATMKKSPLPKDWAAFTLIGGVQ